MGSLPLHAFLYMTALQLSALAPLNEMCQLHLCVMSKPSEYGMPVSRGHLVDGEGLGEG